MTETKFIKNSLVLFTILVSGFLTCQDYEFKKIDSLLTQSFNSRKKYNDFEGLKYAKAASSLAEKTGNSERMARSYYSMAISLSHLRLQKQSLFYIEKAYDQPYTKNNIVFESKLKEVKSYNYMTLGLTSQSQKELFGIVNLLRKKEDTASTKVLIRVYGHIGKNYQNKSKMDSAFIYYKLKDRLLKKFPEPYTNIYRNLSDHYIELGNAFLKKQITDSAFYYYQKSYQLKQKYNNPVLFMEYIQFGNYYRQLKEYQKALDFYQKAVRNMEDYSVNQASFNYVYSDISKMYGVLGDKEMQNKYEGIYLKMENKALIEKHENIDYALNIIIKDYEKRYKTSQKKKNLWLYGGVIIALLALAFLIFKITPKKRTHKELPPDTAINTPIPENEVISQKSTDQDLQLKSSDAYNELIKFSKNNDSSFYFRFQQVYPQFEKKILEVCPGLRTSELILCAYIFLGFTIKDIAEYTFKSVHTIRNRKQNLRKKFNIPTERDMGIWLRELMES
ncbi:transcriptional regulator [Chryseobacterium tongliaoense]|uniref:transcriptional regulator n=1 Tax=Chryseobacterium tongliaoense TaxID=3240933 RepID=UPI003516DB83